MTSGGGFAAWQWRYEGRMVCWRRCMVWRENGGFHIVRRELESVGSNSSGVNVIELKWGEKKKDQLGFFPFLCTCDWVMGPWCRAYRSYRNKWWCLSDGLVWLPHRSRFRREDEVSSGHRGQVSGQASAVWRSQWFLTYEESSIALSWWWSLNIAYVMVRLVNFFLTEIRQWYLTTVEPGRRL